jgi:hypothetical protein
MFMSYKEKKNPSLFLVILSSSHNLAFQTFGIGLTKVKRKGLKMLAGNVLTYCKTNNQSPWPPMLRVLPGLVLSLKTLFLGLVYISLENLAGVSQQRCNMLIFGH